MELERSLLDQPTELQSLSAQGETNIASASRLHTELKKIKKTGEVNLEDRTISVSWHEEQGFVEQTTNAEMTLKPSSQSEEGTTAIAGDIASILNECQQRDREVRRADRYPLREQDRSGFLREFLEDPGVAEGTAVRIAHSQIEESVTPAIVHSLYEQGLMQEEAAVGKTSSPEGTIAVLKASSDLTLGSIPLRERPLLVYGFDRGYREELTLKLQNHFGFQRIQKMQNYMQGLQIKSESSFADFCDFMDLAEVEHGLRQRINRVAASPCNQADLESWADFLQENMEEFDFSRKVNTSEGKRKFFFKNCDLQKILFPFRNQRRVKDYVRDDIKQQRWNKIIERLSKKPTELSLSAFDLLKNQHNLSPSQLKAEYEKLPKDTQRIFDVIILKAFLRKTSKLGLAFAASRRVTVVFAWTASKEEGESVNLEELHALLEVKPYKKEEFRIDIHKALDAENPVAQYAPEATTFSEMREMYRLREKAGAPAHVLVREVQVINSPPPPAVANSSITPVNARGYSRFRKSKKKN